MFFVVECTNYTNCLYYLQYFNQEFNAMHMPISVPWIRKCNKIVIKNCFDSFHISYNIY